MLSIRVDVKIKGVGVMWKNYSTRSKNKQRLTLFADVGDVHIVDCDGPKHSI